MSNSTTHYPVSKKTAHIGAGILGDIYGLDELPRSCISVSCLWLLHGRLVSKDSMQFLASGCLQSWQKRQSPESKVGLIAIAFDQRNHGTRLVHDLANEAWRGGNETHAQDMFSVFNGTAIDVSHLIDHIGSYLFHDAESPSIGRHLAVGYSLGGHTVWQLFFNEPRITEAVVIVGCPDYARLLKDRARLSKRTTYTASNGADFFGSKDFPNALISSVQKYDPKGILFGSSDIPVSLSETERKRLGGILDSRVKGKQLLLCSGGRDKLVPYHCAEPFLQFLKGAIESWYKDGDVSVEDIVYPEAGHECRCSEAMVKDITRFISDVMAEADTGVHRVSKI
ncbi:Alpha/Beta hydrolase protein [Bisporella sp. PMI_857]|nr:Alpha/Beta hydrolase protein [Bisporella sp. PMI_857]